MFVSNKSLFPLSNQPIIIYLFVNILKLFNKLLELVVDYNI